MSSSTRLAIKVSIEDPLKCYRRRRWTRLALVFALGAMAITGSRAAEGRPEMSAESGYVLFEWTDCGIPERQFFSVQVSKEGNLRFKGSKFVRERGAHTQDIPIADAAALISSAKKISRRRIPDIRNEESEQVGVRDSYCVRALIMEGGEPRARGAVLARNPADIKLVQLVERIVMAKRWVCPVRSAGFDSVFSQAPYCDDPLVRIHLAEANACASSRSIHVFADGTIRQVATQAFNDDAGYPTFVPAGDAFVVVSPKTVSALVDLAKSFPAMPDGLDEPNPSHPYVLRGTGADIARFRAALESKAGVKWIEIQKPAVECGRDQKSIDFLSVAR